jgi:hypothetical protein
MYFSKAKFKPSIMKHIQLLSLLAITALLVCCKKDKLVLPPWSITIIDSNKTYNFTGNSYKQLKDGDRAFFDAESHIAYSSGGVPLVFVASSDFSTYNGNAALMRLNVLLLDSNQPLLGNMNPANSLDARFAAMQQWLLSKKFIVNGAANTQDFIIKYTDESGKSWATDFNLLNTIDITDVTPYEHTGYTKCFKATIKFNLNMRFDLSAVRKNISGSMTGFFTLDK